MDLNPYDELGVDRDADRETIRKAHRRRVRKTHPDVGGDAEAFARTQTALAVLTDPKRRKTYDETGKIDEAEPDNTQANALSLLTGFLDRVIGEFINVPPPAFSSGGDPRRRDLLAEFIAATNNEISQISAALISSEKALRFLNDMKRRFKIKKNTSNMIVRRLEVHIDDIERQRATMREAIDIRNVAIKLAGDYDFERDQPAPPPGWSEAQMSFVSPYGGR